MSRSSSSLASGEAGARKLNAASCSKVYGILLSPVQAIMVERIAFYTRPCRHRGLSDGCGPPDTYSLGRVMNLSPSLPILSLSPFHPPPSSRVDGVWMYAHTCRRTTRSGFIAACVATHLHRPTETEGRSFAGGMDRPTDRSLMHCVFPPMDAKRSVIQSAWKVDHHPILPPQLRPYPAVENLSYSVVKPLYPRTDTHRTASSS